MFERNTSKKSKSLHLDPLDLMLDCYGDYLTREDIVKASTGKEIDIITSRFFAVQYAQVSTPNLKMKVFPLSMLLFVKQIEASEIEALFPTERIEMEKRAPLEIFGIRLPIQVRSNILTDEKIWTLTEDVAKGFGPILGVTIDFHQKIETFSSEYLFTVSPSGELYNKFSRRESH